MKVDKDSEKYKDKAVVNTVLGTLHVPELRRTGKSMLGKLSGLLERGAIKVMTCLGNYRLSYSDESLSAESCGGSSEWFGRDSGRAWIE